MGLADGQLISGFNANDTLFLSGFEGTAVTYADGVLTLSNSTSTETLHISTSLKAPVFTADAFSGGTEITMCFMRGTRIATPAGEVPVEALAIGDAVVTRFGGVRRVKWLGRQSYDRRFIEHNLAKMPVRIAAGALAAGLPGRDLFVSPGHSMLLGDTLVLAHLLVNGVSITQNEALERIDYIHIELETHDCVLAEGCWSESYANGPGLRAQYHNAAEFCALYPDDVMPESLRLCAARPESGPVLAAALMPVALRAAAMVAPGALCGFVDEIGADGLVRGWAQDAAHPALPILLAVIFRGQIVGITLACAYWADLAAAGLGRCGFVFQAPTGLKACDVGVCRVIDGAMLAFERELKAAAFL